MRRERHLVAFVREPRLGRVKTRLARDIGGVAAWQFYREALAGVLRRLGPDGRWRCWLAVTPDRTRATPGLWPAGWQRVGQGSGDLGVRLARVMRSLPPGPAVIVGTDVPDLERRHVAAAFRALGAADVVLGPAADGGYWLIGAKRCPRLPALFAGVRWSTAHALADTLGNARGLRVVLLDTLEDVDDGADWSRLQARRRG